MAISKILNMKDCGGHFHGKHLKRSGLTIDPCLPDSIKALTITRKFRGATYNITISNTKHERVSSLIVNGNEITGNTVPFNADTKEFNVIVNI